MKRRSFLQTLLGVAGSTAILGNAHTTTKLAPVILLETNLAGFQYYQGRQLFPQLKIGDPLHLRRAPENKYDNRAVEVYWQNNMLGHIPRIANMSISQMLDRNAPLTASITQLTASDNPWHSIHLAVYLNQGTESNQ